MLKVTRNTYGPVDNLKVIEVDIPNPSDDEILIQTKASTVNRTDEGVLLGKPFIFRFFVGFPKPRILTTGTDFSGVIIDKGKNVDKFRKGDEVYGFLDHNIGSHAQYFCINQNLPIFTKPKKITHIQAAASLEGAHYAFYFLSKVHIKEGQKVMVNGATGAIGNAMVQMLIDKKVDLTITYPGDSYEKIKKLKVKKAIDYLKEDFTKQNCSFDYVFDAVGKSTFGACKNILKPGGVYISSELGPNAENIPLSIWGLFHKGKRVAFPFPNSPKKSIPEIKKMLENGTFIPLIEKTYKLSEIQQAFNHMLSGQKRGSVVIDFDK